MINIKFIVPSWHHLFNPFLHQPYWEMYYATNLKNKLNELKIDHKISILDTRGDPELINNVEECDFYIYWIYNIFKSSH